MSQHRSSSIEPLGRKTRNFLLQYGFFRLESAIIIAITVLCVALSLMGMPWMPGAWWMWLIAGAIAEAGIVLSTLRDEQLKRKLGNQLFNEQFDLNEIKSIELRQKVAKALEYREMLVVEIERRQDPMLDAQLMDTANGMDAWIEQIYRLAIGIDAYLNDPIIAADMRTVPKEMAQYEARRVRMSAGTVQAELDKTLKMKRDQLEAMNTLKDIMAKAQLQLDNTLTAMSTIYMQAKMIGSKDMRSTRTQRLQDDMQEQINVLRDTSTTLDDLYQPRKAAQARGG